MQCPKCKNHGFIPSADVKKPLRNLGDKEYFPTFITRRYVCMQCGHRFVTKEEYYRDITATVATASLFGPRMPA